MREHVFISQTFLLHRKKVTVQDNFFTNTFFCCVRSCLGKMMLATMTIFFTFLQYSKRDFSQKNNHISNEGQDRRMLKGPALKSSGLYILVVQDRSDGEAFNMFENMFKMGYYFSYFWTNLEPVGIF